MSDAPTRPPASKCSSPPTGSPPAWASPKSAIVDGSFYLPALKRDAKAEYLAGHIPGAVFFDIDAIADHSTDLPHMLPGATQFSKDVGALGIGKDDTIVVYDGAGLGGAPRVWWTFRVFGAKNVYILDGGLPKWKAEGRPVEAGDAQAHAAQVRSRAEHARWSPDVSDVQMALIEQFRAGGRCAAGQPLPRRGAGAARPASAAATCRARSTCR